MTHQTPLRVCVVDDDDFVRASLADIIDHEADMDCVITCSDGTQAQQAADSEDIDVFLMDVRMPVLDGVQATRLIKSEHPDAKILMWTSFESDDALQEALAHGAAGFVLKNCGPKALLDALRATRWGLTVLSPEQRTTLAQPLSPAELVPDPDLDEIDRKILSHLVRGLTNHEIAAAIFKSESTVKSHITSLMRALQVDNRVQLALAALRQGFGS